ncbi:MAG: YfhO family protein [Candidatus Omnitrophica bacterium]|nr:YfhO family protein [Candidatus Omnitrophota bacterium]MBU1128606.1 YfhO family protein [Candidatus Omnitrophota bacterium]MBU1784733.1 YfhO family protein [Candidatus Omnitrophota bacterium]MBU1851544.1 YfhO family protein [Candidatus Omnitrophota bacterium]
MRKHGGFIIFFTVVIFIFLWKLILMKGAFLGGDYLAQFYPWSMIYADSIKGFSFPFWTRFFQSGFPLMAEGQVGGFYPFNFIFFFLLPFRAAYNYIVVFHFILAGLFTYAYTRKLGSCQWGGAVSALLFCFGSAYAGCFYNTVTVKTLIWVPLVLLLFEKYFNNKKTGYILGAGLVLGIQLLAGFAQAAIYSALFYAVYFIYGLKLRGNLKLKDVIVLFAGFFLAALIFFPQFALSWPLAKASGRADASLGFALWGSFAPFNFISLVFPYSVFHGTRFYIGVLSLLFVVASFFKLKSTTVIRPVFLIFLLSIFFALGEYNPLYVIFLKLTGFYSFRNPSKFLFFGIFACSVMAGYGFTVFFHGLTRDAMGKALRAFSLFISSALGAFFIAKGTLLLFGEKIVDFGIRYVTDHVYGKSFHRYDLPGYVDRVRDFYGNMVQKTSILDPFVITSLVLCIIALAFAKYLSKKGNSGPLLKGAFVSLIFLDLLIFGVYGTGFRGNIESFDTLKPDYPAIFKTVSRDKDIFRILPYGAFSGELPAWSIPNANAAYGIDSVAAYSPLASKLYRHKLKGAEAVDDSLGLLKPEPDFIKENRDLLRSLNVKYIISSEELEETGLKKIQNEGDVYLYELKETFPRGYAARSLKEPAEIIGGLAVIEEYRSGYADFFVDIEEDGYFIFSEFNYPGWQATVDGIRTRIEKFQDILMAVRLSAGKHKVTFRYSPYKNDQHTRF